MIEFANVSKSFAGQPVLSGISFRVNPGERVGIVGPNGAGKTTLFNLIIGEMLPDNGRVTARKDCRLGYVRQHIAQAEAHTPLLAYVENALPEARALENEIIALEQNLSETSENARPPLMRRLGELQTRLEAIGAYALKHRAEQALSGMGFQIAELSKKLASFSGGMQSRAELGRALTAQPDVLLLDEPSNYLDTPSVEWLQKYLREYKGTLLLISHDRFLLNSLTSVTVEIANAKAERYPGNYDAYRTRRDQKMEQLLAAHKNQERERARIERFVERFRAKNTKATQVQSRIKQLERMETIALPEHITSPGRLRLAKPPPCGAEVVRLENAGLSYDGKRWILRELNFSVSRGEKLALLGYNGLGKTTLLRALAGQMKPTEGKRVLGHKVSIGYQSQDFAETMDPTATAFAVVKEAAPDATALEIRAMLGSLGFSGDAVEKSARVLSGGEKIRLAFARLLIRPPNFLLLDEPTTHLDIQARQALEQALADFEGTICMVSHDIDFLRRVATGILAITPPGITRYAGGYDYYREKLQAEQAAAQPAARTATQEKTDISQSRKEQRRQRAATRQAELSRLRSLKRNALRIEEQIEVFETERANLTQQLASGAPDLDFASLNRRLRTIHEEIERYTGQWEAIAAELQEPKPGQTLPTEPTFCGVTPASSTAAILLSAHPDQEFPREKNRQDQPALGK